MLRDTRDSALKQLSFLGFILVFVKKDFLVIKRNAAFFFAQCFFIVAIACILWITAEQLYHFRRYYPSHRTTRYNERFRRITTISPSDGVSNVSLDSLTAQEFSHMIASCHGTHNQLIRWDISVDNASRSQLKYSLQWESSEEIPDFFADSPIGYYKNDDEDDTYDSDDFLSTLKYREIFSKQHCVDGVYAGLFNVSWVLGSNTFGISNTNAFNAFFFLRSMFMFSIIAYVVTAVFTTHRIMKEKESGIHTYMVVMGMPRGSYYLMHLISATFQVFVISGITGAGYLVYLEFGKIIVSFYFLYGLVIVYVAVFLTTIFRNAAYTILTLVLLVAASVVATYVFPPKIFEAYRAVIHAVFNPYAVVQLGMEDIMTSIVFETGMDFFVDLKYYFSLGVCYIVLGGQICVILLLTLYFDYVMPSDDSSKKHPFFICGYSQQKKRNAGYEPTFYNPDNFEDEKSGSNLVVGVSVNDLVKRWPTGDLAINHVSFNAYEGQVTAVLGHNGAGKSTLFGCLTGFIKPTSGDMQVQQAAAIGYCPQWDPLFSWLTCEEHLRFYGALKIAERVSEEEVTRVLALMQLSEVSSILARNLSSGMRRRLCVAIAVIGNSKVVLLDEPTAGMDPAARQNVIQMIDQLKEGRTVLLTTHYMDEAELLSDRICIMAHGELVCNGSSDFLKKRFGSGFLLTIVFKNCATKQPHELDYLARDIMDVVRGHCEQAQVEGPVGNQFVILLPFGQQRLFGDMFEELETKRHQLGILSFGLSINSLEQVFIKVNESVDPASSPQMGEKVKQLIDLLKEERCLPCVWFYQFLALFIRKFHYFRRHLFLLLLPFLLIIPPAAFGLMYTFMPSEQYSARQVNLDLSAGPRMQIWFKRPEQESSEIEKRAFDNLIEELKRPNVEVDVFEFYEGYPMESYFFTLPFLAADISVSKSFGSFVMFNVFYKENFPFVRMIVENAIANSLLKPYGARIEMDLYILVQEALRKRIYTVDIVSKFVGGYLLYSVTLALPIFVYAAERKQNTDHLYGLGHLSKLVYWGTSFVCDLLWGAPFIAASLLANIGSLSIIHSRALMFRAALLSVPTTLSFMLQTFLAAKFATSGTRAFAFLLAFNLLLGPGIFYGSVKIRSLMRLDTFCRLVFPIASIDLYINSFIPPRRIYGGSYLFTDRRFDYYPFYQAALYFILLLSITVGKLLRNLVALVCCCQRRQRVGTELDPGSESRSDVAEELIKVMEVPPSTYMIASRHLRKEYWTSTCSHTVALAGLSLGISKGECFGLLGSNGAGKSTTFNVLSGVLKPTSGRAYIAGKSITGFFKPRFGFCPQNNAILFELTIVETFKLFARISGRKNINQCVTILLELLKLTRVSKHTIRNCSGGERRRVSIGVAILTNCRVIMLDEPTAGIDARTRHRVWDILIGFRTAGSSILLSSHSMDECETLCTRIGILMKGRLHSIGSSQHLKSTCGNSYTLRMILSNYDASTISSLNIAVRQSFASDPLTTTPHSCVLTWTIPKLPGVTWSSLYKRLIQFIDNFDATDRDSRSLIKDFALVETTLEQVFIATCTDHHVPFVPVVPEVQALPVIPERSAEAASPSASNA